VSEKAGKCLINDIVIYILLPEATCYLRYLKV